MHTFYYTCLALLMICCGCTQKVTLNSLLEEMTDRESLTYYPGKPFTHNQFSSYNRESIAPGKEGWFANADMSHFIRVENNQGRREFVMFDTDGSGVIVRWWMTFYKAQNGIIRIYIDHDTVPVIQGPANEILSGTALTGPPLAVSVHKGVIIREKGRDLDHNLYLPIPFAEHCKITFEYDSLLMYKPGYYFPDVFYNIGCRRYEPGTKVESISTSALRKAESSLNKAKALLTKTLVSSIYKTEFDQEILPGKSFSIDYSQKNRAVNYLLVQVSSSDIQQALRSTVFSVSFDGKQTIWVPVGEFFGTGYRMLSHRTWMNETHADGSMESFWVMPYQDSCRLTFANYSNDTVRITGKAGLSDYKWKSSSMYFGAAWHEYYHINTRDEKGSYVDLNFIDLKGKGIYAGDQITLFNTSYEWWGEGDEKIFVDGESFPSIFGTGSEDYYGYGFGRPDPFSHPFISQPVGEGNEGNSNGGLTINMRHRSLDAIPFTASISANIELWHWAETCINYALTSYWYVQFPFETNILPDIQSVQRTVTRSANDFYNQEE
jgi:hypothetical protein